MKPVETCGIYISKCRDISKNMTPILLHTVLLIKNLLENVFVSFIVNHPVGGHPSNYQTVKCCLLLCELNTPASVMNMLEQSHILHRILYLDAQRDYSIIETIHAWYKYLLQTRNTSVKTNNDIDLHFLFLRIYQRVQWKVPRIFRLEFRHRHNFFQSIFKNKS